MKSTGAWNSAHWPPVSAYGSELYCLWKGRPVPQRRVGGNPKHMFMSPSEPADIYWGIEDRERYEQQYRWGDVKRAGIM